MRKRLKQIAALLCIGILCFGMCACTEVKEDDISGYEGKVFEGTNPWGRPISISIDKVHDNQIDWTCNERIDENFTLNYSNKDSVANQNMINFNAHGEILEPPYCINYNYEGKIDMHEGELVVIYLSGYKSKTNGKELKHFDAVEELPDDEKKIVLTAK